MYVGQFLGEFVSELKPGVAITEFVCIGAKAYAERYSNGTSKVRMKGFAHTLWNDQYVNMASMLELIPQYYELGGPGEFDNPDVGMDTGSEDDDDIPSDPEMARRLRSKAEVALVVQVSRKRKRKKSRVIEGAKNIMFNRDHTGDVYVDWQDKVFKFTFDKRWVDWESGKSYPFGFIRSQ